jgi:predicted small secreted protein
VISATRPGIAKKEFCMRNIIKFFGIVALVALIGFSMAACDNDGGGGGGGIRISGTTWTTYGGLGEISFTASNFTMKAFGMMAASGTYRIEGENIIITYTAIGPGAGDDDVVGRILYFEIIDDNTLRHEERPGDIYYWTRVR